MQEHYYVNVHCHDDNCEKDTIAIQNIFAGETTKIPTLQNKIISVGIHPWHIHLEQTIKQLNNIEIQAQSRYTIAIGEMGLDRNAEAPQKLQEEYFIKQYLLAEQYQKPLIIHCVRCFSQLLFLHKKLKPNSPWIIHGFNGNQQIADQLIKKGIYLSFGENLFHKGDKIQKVFSNTPLNSIFLETDESKISIKEIYQRATVLKKLPLEELKKLIANNFKTCFKK